jgi:hypothetical protein
MARSLEMSKEKSIMVIYSGVASYKHKHCGGDIRNKNKTLKFTFILDIEKRENTKILLSVAVD